MIWIFLYISYINNLIKNTVYNQNSGKKYKYKKNQFTVVYLYHFVWKFSRDLSFINRLLIKV
jgi:hypothetical protein